MTQILGMHDWDPAWGELVRQWGHGGWCTITEAIGSDPKDDRGRDYSSLADCGVVPIVRLNHAYGQGHGTIPKEDRYVDFAARCMNFVRASKGCKRWVIGNETNMRWESPYGDGRLVSVGDYARCFRFCREAILRVQPDAEIMPAPVAPWNASQGDWIELQGALWEACWPFGGVAIHAYTHGHDADLIKSDTKMNPPYEHRHYNFRVYRDFLSVVPAAAKELPVYITEANPDGWYDEDNGWIQEAAAEIARWNRLRRSQKIHALCLYRWPDFDKAQFTICNKGNVIGDFDKAVQMNVTPPASDAAGALQAEPVPDPVPAPAEIEHSPVNEVVQTFDSFESLGIVNVRVGPGLSYEVVDQLMTGEVVRSSFREGDWVRIDRGWCCTVWNGYPLLGRIASENWRRAISHIMAWEGGYVNDPRDPGGETNWGISKRAYPHLDIPNLSNEDAEEIYRRDYWMRSGANDLDWPLCLTHFDFAVNAGVWRACQTLGESGGDVERYNDLRESFYRSIRGFVHFGAAWLRRVQSARDA